MKKTTIFLSIALLAMLSLAGCTPDHPCTNGYTYNPNYQNPDGTLGACMYTGNPGTGTGYINTGGSVTGVGQGTPNASITAGYNQAYADADGDGWADLAGANTLAGGTTDNTWYYTYVTDGYGALHPARISLGLLNVIRMNFSWNSVANFWSRTGGSGHIVFVYQQSVQYESGNTAVGPYVSHTNQYGQTVSQQQCVGTPIFYTITDYNIVN